MLTRRELLRRAGGLGLLAATGSLLEACGSLGGRSATRAAAKGGGASGQGPGKARPVLGGTLTILTADAIASINPAHEADWNSDQSLYNMFDTLLTYDSQNRPRPMLATGWQASADATRFTFKIRRGMRFQDGTAVDAGALKENIAWYGDPANRSPLYASLFQDLDHAEAPDPRTLVLVSKVPKVPADFFAAFLFGPLFASPAAFADAGRFSAHPVGSGPFAFDAYVAEDRLRMKRFDGWWGGRPYLDAVEVRIVPGQTAQLDALLNGSVDFAFSVPPQNVEPLQSKGVRIAAGVSPGAQMLALNLNNPLLADLNVRKAIAYALDRGAIVRKVLYGYATPAVALVSPNSPQFDQSLQGYGYDPARARRILAAEGWRPGPDGVLTKADRRLALTLATQTDPTWLLICRIVQQELRQIGIAVRVQQTDWPAFLANVRAGDYDIAYWSPLGLSFSGIAYAANLQSTGYGNVSQMDKNPQFKTLSQQFDTVIAAAQSATDPAAYRQLCDQFQRLVLASLPVIPLWHMHHISATQPWVHGLLAPSEFPLCRAERAWKSRPA